MKKSAKKSASILIILVMLLSFLNMFNVSAYDNNEISSVYLTDKKSINMFNKDEEIESYPDISVINASDLSQINKTKLKAYIENGTYLLIQNNNNCNSDYISRKIEIKTLSKVEYSDAENIINLGYCVSVESTGDYLIKPIVGILLLQEGTEQEKENEITSFKSMKKPTINPKEFYSEFLQKRNNDSNKNDTINDDNQNLGSLQLRISSAYVTNGGYGYLYGKNGNSSWGYQSGYTLFGYIEIAAYVIRETTINGYKYDAVECGFTATGLGNKYVKSFTTQNIVISNTQMVGYTYLNQQNQYTYETSYSISGDGPSTSYSIGATINPGNMTMTTQKTNNHVVWYCTPNSHLRNKTWYFEAGCLTSTANNKTATVGIGFNELIVDNLFYQYTSPGGIGFNISYS